MLAPDTAPEATHRDPLNDKVIRKMWFSNPIKHAIPETNWPSEEDARRSLLFQPIRIGQTELTSRTWVPAWCPGAPLTMACDSGKHRLVSQVCGGQPGALVVEATGVRDIPSGPLLRIGDDRFITWIAPPESRARSKQGSHTSFHSNHRLPSP